MKTNNQATTGQGSFTWRCEGIGFRKSGLQKGPFYFESSFVSMGLNDYLLFFFFNPFRAYRTSYDRDLYLLIIWCCVASCLNFSFAGIITTNEVLQSSNFGQRNLHLRLLLKGNCTNNAKITGSERVPVPLNTAYPP